MGSVLHKSCIFCSSQKLCSPPHATFTYTERANIGMSPGCESLDSLESLAQRWKGRSRERACRNLELFWARNWTGGDWGLLFAYRLVMELVGGRRSWKPISGGSHPKGYSLAEHSFWLLVSFWGPIVECELLTCLLRCSAPGLRVPNLQEHHRNIQKLISIRRKVEQMKKATLFSSSVKGRPSSFLP